MTEGPPHLDNDVDTTDTQLTLHRTLEQLDEPRRDAVARWLIAHDIDPGRVALDAPIQRDETTFSLAWREQTDEGLGVHRVFPAVTKDDHWPAPFPEELRRSAPVDHPRANVAHG